MTDERCIICEERVVIQPGRSVKFEAVKDCHIAHNYPYLPNPLQMYPGETLTIIAKGPGPTFVDYRTDEARLVTREEP